MLLSSFRRVSFQRRRKRTESFVSRSLAPRSWPTTSGHGGRASRPPASPSCCSSRVCPRFFSSHSRSFRKAPVAHSSGGAPEAAETGSCPAPACPGRAANSALIHHTRCRRLPLSRRAHADWLLGSGGGGTHALIGCPAAGAGPRCEAGARCEGGHAQGAEAVAAQGIWSGILLFPRAVVKGETSAVFSSRWSVICVVFTPMLYLFRGI